LQEAEEKWKKNTRSKKGKEKLKNKIKLGGRDGEQ
jgi:hypothetical protein